MNNCNLCGSKTNQHDSDIYLIRRALEEYRKNFEGSTMSAHDLDHLIERYNDKKCPWCGVLLE